MFFLEFYCKRADKCYNFLVIMIMRGNKRADVPIKGVRKAKVGYPNELPTDFRLKEDVLTVCFSESNSAIFF